MQVAAAQEVSSRRGFRSASVRPLTGRIRGSRGWFKRAVAGTLLGASLVVGGASGSSGCNCGGSKIEQPAGSEVKQYTSTTNVEGKAVFEVGGKTFELSVVSVKTGEPLQNLAVTLFTDGFDGVYFINDLTGDYLFTIAGVREELRDSSFGLRRALEGERVSRTVSVYKTSDVYEENIGVVEQGLKFLYEHRDFLNAAFEHKTFTLGELDNAVLAWAAESTTSILPYQWVVSILGKAGKIGFAVFEAIEVVSSFEEKYLWSKFYKSFCWPDDAKFEVYRINYLPTPIANAIPDFPLIPQAPTFLVLPKADPSLVSWEAPTAKVNGAVSDSTTLESVEFARVRVNHPADRSFELIAGNGSYETTVSTCENRTPTYSLSSYRPRLSILSDARSVEYPAGESASFTAVKGDEFKADFVLNSAVQSCATGYRTFYPDADGDCYVNGHRMTVSCSQPQGKITNDNGLDCNDNDQNAGMKQPNGACSPANTRYWPDRDGDWKGDHNAQPTTFCARPSEYVTNNEDCDDNDRNVGSRAERTVSCNNGRGSQTDTCERGAWAFGDCQPITDGGPPVQRDGGSGRADGGASGARDAGDRADGGVVDGGFSDAGMRDGGRDGGASDGGTTPWQPNCRIISQESVTGPDQYGLTGSWAVILSSDFRTITYVNLDSFVPQSIPVNLVSSLATFGDSVYSKAFNATIGEYRFVRYRIPSGEFTELRPMHQGVVLSNGAIYGVYGTTAVVSPDFYVFDVNDETGHVTDLSPCNPQTRQVNHPSIYGNIVVTQETSFPNQSAENPLFYKIYAHTIDGNSCWQVSGEEMAIAAAIYANKVAYLVQLPTSGSYYAVYSNSVYGGEPTTISPPEYSAQGNVSMWGSKIVYPAYPLTPRSQEHVLVYDENTGETRDYGTGCCPRLGERGLIYHQRVLDENGNERGVGVVYCETE